MSEQHAALLKKARERLVEDRRGFAKIIAAPFERERTNDARVRFIEMQMAIEAVDRAIEDEENDDEGSSKSGQVYLCSATGVRATSVCAIRCA